MKFKESEYYNRKFLTKKAYKRICDIHCLYDVKEYFNINGFLSKIIKKKNFYKSKELDYSLGSKSKMKLRVFDDYYELNQYEENDLLLYLIFDKPVHIIGKRCFQIIAPEIIINNNCNCEKIYGCFTDKLEVKGGKIEICDSKFKNVMADVIGVEIICSEIENFFIKNKDIMFSPFSNFLKDYKIKVFGKSENLKKRISEYKDFKNRIIHIE